MSSPLQTRTQDNVLAAQIRGALNNGPEWNTAGSTLADATTALADLVTGTATTAQIATKVNTILALIKNLNVTS